MNSLCASAFAQVCLIQLPTKLKCRKSRFFSVDLIIGMASRISENVGRRCGSWCQQYSTNSANLAGVCFGSAGLARCLATANAATQEPWVRLHEFKPYRQQTLYWRHSTKWLIFGNHLPQHYSKAIDVSLWRVRFMPNHFWSHPTIRSCLCRQVRSATIVKKTAKPKIGDLDETVRIYQYVARFEVTMNHGAEVKIIHAHRYIFDNLEEVQETSTRMNQVTQGPISHILEDWGMKALWEVIFGSLSLPRQ